MMDADRLAEQSDWNISVCNIDEHVRLRAEVERLQAENGLLRRSLEVVCREDAIDRLIAPRSDPDIRPLTTDIAQYGTDDA